MREGSFPDRDHEIDELLKRAADAGQPVDPALLDRIAGSIRPSLRPVRPLPPSWALKAALVLICATVAVVGASVTRAGFAGVEALSTAQRAVIFPALGILACLAAAAWVAEMLPGSRRWLAPAVLAGGASGILLAIFGFLLNDPPAGNFVKQGLVCLSAGLLYAVPAALAGWFVVRRGFAVHPVAAGVAAGTLAGLAGVGMLELHCANLQPLHAMLWHTAVIPIGAVAGALLGWRRRSRAI